MIDIDRIWGQFPAAVSVLPKTAGEADNSFMAPFKQLRDFVAPSLKPAAPPAPAKDWVQDAADAAKGSTAPPPAAPSTPPVAAAPKSAAPAADAGDDAVAIDAGGGEPRREIQPNPAQSVVDTSSENVLASFHGQLGNIGSRKAYLNTLDPSSVAGIAPAKWGLEQHLPVSADMTPEQLAGAMRRYMAIGRTDLAKQLGDMRLFPNPHNPESKMTFKELGGAYSGIAKGFSDENRALHAKSLYMPGVPGLPSEESYAKEQLEPLMKNTATDAQAQIKAQLAEIDKDPKAAGFTDWLTSSWSNIAVPAGLLMMIFGGNTGAILGGIAVAAGGYDLYNRYQTLTKDPVAQTAITEFMNARANPEALKDIETRYGPRYSKAAMDFVAAAKYGFLSTVQNAPRNAAVAAHKAFLPNSPQADVDAFGASIPGATTAENPTLNDWAAKAYDQGSEWVNGAKGWLAGTPAAAAAK